MLTAMKGFKPKGESYLQTAMADYNCAGIGVNWVMLGLKLNEGFRAVLV